MIKTELHKIPKKFYCECGKDYVNKQNLNQHKETCTYTPPPPPPPPAPPAPQAPAQDNTMLQMQMQQMQIEMQKLQMEREDKREERREKKDEKRKMRE